MCERAKGQVQYKEKAFQSSALKRLSVDTCQKYEILMRLP